MRHEVSSTFLWYDQSHFEFSNWATGEPSNDEETCLEMKTSQLQAGLWNDVSCTDKRAVLCEKDKSEPKSITAMLASKPEIRQNPKFLVKTRFA